MINYELIKNNLPPSVIDIDNRIKYYDLLRKKDIKQLAIWLEELSNKELERMKMLGY